MSKETLETEMSSIRTFGGAIIWRNSNTVRYLRIWIKVWKLRYEFDFFRKDKLLDRLAEKYHIGDLPSEPQRPLHTGGSTGEGLKKSITRSCKGKTDCGEHCPSSTERKS